MNVESKIWKYSNTGTTVHCFDGGVALCNSNIRRFTSDAGIDYSEARDGHKFCTKCDTKFNAIIEAAEAETVAETPAEVKSAKTLAMTDKVWNVTRSGSKIHAFLNGLAVCRGRIGEGPTVAYDATAARKRVAKTPGLNLCEDCVYRFAFLVREDELRSVRFERNHAEALAMNETMNETTTATEEEETMTTHLDAGTYYPMDGDDYLRVQGLTILAEVHTDGTYAVFAQSQRIDRGRLNGTEGSLMRFFTNIARMWSARIDDERAQEATRRAEAEYAHHAEATIDTTRAEARTPEQMATVVEALGGLFMLRNMSDDQDVPTNANTVAEAILNAQQYGYKVEMRDNPEGHRYPWHVAMSNRHGATRFQYHYMGH
jgi:hypothetical protein